MGVIDKEVIEASKTKVLKNNFIQKNELFIRKCASSAVHRFISKSDDEWSIALFAFSEAMDQYSIEKGSFYSFAELVIHRKIIDYLRSTSKLKSEILIEPSMLNVDAPKDDKEIALQKQISKKLIIYNDNSIKYEIEAVNEIFQMYGFSFFDLADCSPKAMKTKKACKIIISFILLHPAIIDQIRSTKTLPIKNFEKRLNVPRKILERHRKYVIAVVEILSGEYPYLSEYVRSMREE